MWFKRYYVYVLHGRGKPDVWEWNGKQQKLLFRGTRPVDKQPELSDDCAQYKRRLFRFEKGVTPCPLIFTPVRKGLLDLSD